jgi:sensor histidine kinase YesM
VGLENVTRRLEHYYGVDASLTVARDADGATVAELRLPATSVDDGDVEVVVRRPAP